MHTGTRHLPFSELSPAQRRQAQAQFFDAHADDGCLYELGPTGHVLSRSLLEWLRHAPVLT